MIDCALMGVSRHNFRSGVWGVVISLYAIVPKCRQFFQLLLVEDDVLIHHMFKILNISLDIIHYMWYPLSMITQDIVKTNTQALVTYDVNKLLNKTEDLIDLRIANELRLTELISHGVETDQITVESATLNLSKLCSLSELIKLRNLLVNGTTGDGDTKVYNFTMEDINFIAIAAEKVSSLSGAVDRAKHVIEVKSESGRG